MKKFFYLSLISTIMMLIFIIAFAYTDKREQIIKKWEYLNKAFIIGFNKIELTTWNEMIPQYISSFKKRHNAKIKILKSNNTISIYSKWDKDTVNIPKNNFESKGIISLYGNYKIAITAEKTCMVCHNKSTIGYAIINYKETIIDSQFIRYYLPLLLIAFMPLLWFMFLSHSIKIANPKKQYIIMYGKDYSYKSLKHICHKFYNKKFFIGIIDPERKKFNIQDIINYADKKLLVIKTQLSLTDKAPYIREYVIKSLKSFYDKTDSGILIIGFDNLTIERSDITVRKGFYINKRSQKKIPLLFIEPAKEIAI